MQINKAGKQTLVFRKKPSITAGATVVGTKEGAGPLRQWFDLILDDDTFGEKTWEKTESKMLKEAMKRALDKSAKTPDEIDAILCGDLLNQLMSSAYMARDMKIPFIGLYGACSTMTESLLMGSVLVDGGYASNVLIGASSHYCTAERQFRMPLEHGNQRVPSAQWTATAAGAMVVSSQDSCPNNLLTGRNGEIKPKKQILVTHGTIGKIIDAGIKDVNQMGAAMAPAAVDTILNHFEDIGQDYDYYNMIFTGDLGFIGKEIAADLLVDAGMPPTVLRHCYNDCGAMIYEKEQDVHGGGSGCGCSASVFAGQLYKKMEQGEIERALIISTGAMLSTLSPGQGESIPGIAHAVSLEVR